MSYAYMHISTYMHVCVYACMHVCMHLFRDFDESQQYISQMGNKYAWKQERFGKYSKSPTKSTPCIYTFWISYPLIYTCTWILYDFFLLLHQPERHVSKEYIYTYISSRPCTSRFRQAASMFAVSHQPFCQHRLWGLEPSLHWQSCFMVGAYPSFFGL